MKNEMKRGQIGIILASLVVICILGGLWMMGTYNDLVSSREKVNSQWGNVQTVYQRRFDLIPNLVATVKGYAAHEEGIWDEFALARQQYNTASTPQEQVAATNQIESTLSKLMVVVEQYPELKANENFLELQAQLEGTENRISVERQRYNDEVRTYTTKKSMFPTNLIAGMFNFVEFPYFDSASGADVAPTVSFP